MVGNNLTKRFKLGGPSKLQSGRTLEGTSRCNVFPQKRVYLLTYLFHGAESFLRS